MRKVIFLLMMFALVMLASCSENYSNGERIGVITQFSQTGVIWKSWEGHLNVTQTGMNSSIPFDFSIDNDHEPTGIVATLDSAARFGWKVKLVYHQTWGMKNVLHNRGETNHFVTKVDILEKNFGNFFNGKQNDGINIKGHVIDTIWVVIDKSKIK